MAAFVPSFASFASARRRVRARREGDDPSDPSPIGKRRKSASPAGTSKDFLWIFLIGEFFADDGTGHARRTGLETSAVTVAVTCLA